MLFAGHERLSQPFLAVVAALIGFSTLLTGGYSRFGLWRQIVVAVFLLIGVQFLVNGATNMATRDPELWPVVYLPILAGLAAAVALLSISGRSRRVRHDLVGAVAS